MRARTLRLRKETLSVLDTAQLRAVVGGLSQPCIECEYTWCPDCWNDLSFEHCPTLPIEQCV